MTATLAFTAPCQDELGDHIRAWQTTAGTVPCVCIGVIDVVRLADQHLAAQVMLNVKDARALAEWLLEATAGPLEKLAIEANHRKQSK